MTGEKKLKDLNEHNMAASSFYNDFYSNSPRPNGIACPKCGAELLDSNPNVMLTSMPPKMNTHCAKEGCGYSGYRVA
jgi:hypothetical protein